MRPNLPQLAAEYRRWRKQHEPGPDELGVLRRTNLAWEQRPLVTVVLPVPARRRGVARPIDRFRRSAGLRPVGAVVAIDPSLGPQTDRCR